MMYYTFQKLRKWTLNYFYYLRYLGSCPPTLCKIHINGCTDINTRDGKEKVRQYLGGQYDC